MPGAIEFVKVRIHNAFNQREVYSVHINDPDEKNIFERELVMVTDKTEWRYWISQSKCARPASFEVMTEAGDIILQPNEEVELLFKFLTLREVPAFADLASQPPQIFIRPRKCQIIILHSNKQPYSNTEVHVVPSSAPIDHTFRFFEP